MPAESIHGKHQVHQGRWVESLEPHRAAFALAQQAFDSNGSCSKHLQVVRAAEAKVTAEGDALSCLLFDTLQSMHASGSAQQLLCIVSSAPEDLPAECPSRLCSLLAAWSVLWLDSSPAEAAGQGVGMGAAHGSQQRLQHLLAPHVQSIQVMSLRDWQALDCSAMLQVRIYTAVRRSV